MRLKLVGNYFAYYLVEGFEHVDLDDDVAQWELLEELRGAREDLLDEEAKLGEWQPGDEDAEPDEPAATDTPPSPPELLP
jgi:hypothetical protein